MDRWMKAGKEKGREGVIGREDRVEDNMNDRDMCASNTLSIQICCSGSEGMKKMYFHF